MGIIKNILYFLGIKRPEIKSPSKTFASIGGYFTRGFILGIMTSTIDRATEYRRPYTYKVYRYTEPYRPLEDVLIEWRITVDDYK